MKVDAVIFDLDGTLVDSFDDLADSVNAVLVARGMTPHPRDAYRHFVGDGIRELVRRALGDAPLGLETDTCVSEVRSEYATRWDRKTRPYPRMLEALTTLGARGIAMAILSNKPHALVMRIAERFFARGTFRAVLGAECGFARKPDPAGAIEIARRLDVAPNRCAYVGDTATDMQAACAVEMAPLGALWGFRDATELSAAGAVRLLETPDAVIPVLETLC